MRKKDMFEQLEINGERVLLVGFWGNKNLGDELILLGNIKILLENNKKIFIVSQNNTFLKKFLSQFINTREITFLQELPRGFRSTFKYLFKYIGQIKYFFNFDEVILGGGEILTEENHGSYRYRLRSLRPVFCFKKTNLTIMGGVQIPKGKRNKWFFDVITKYTNNMYVRDYQAYENLKKAGYNNIKFFMDTSYFAIDDWKKFKRKTEKYIIININSNGEKFLGDIISDTLEYVNKGYTIYYLPVSEGLDNDLKYLKNIGEQLGKKAEIKKLNRSIDFFKFLYILGGAEKVIGTRLHLFLISKFIGLETIVYPYQRKIIRMQEVLSKVKI